MQVYLCFNSNIEKNILVENNTFVYGLIVERTGNDFSIKAIVQNF